MSKQQVSRQDYRNLFSSDTGKRVLAHMLTELGFFSRSITSPREIHLSNYARELAGHCRIIAELESDGCVDNRIELVEALMSVDTGNGA